MTISKAKILFLLEKIITESPEPNIYSINIERAVLSAVLFVCGAGSVDQGADWAVFSRCDCFFVPIDHEPLERAVPNVDCAWYFAVCSGCRSLVWANDVLSRRCVCRHVSRFS